MSSQSSSSQCSSGMDEKPLLIQQKPPTAIAIEEGGASEWPCAACGCLLGVLHLSVGLCLLLFDVLTNSVSQTAFAITASLSYIICAILCFIAVRRLDRCAQVILMCFSVFASVASLSIFLESAVQLNAVCVDGALSIPVETEQGGEGFVEYSQQQSFSISRNSSAICDSATHSVLVALIGIALTEFVVCLVTLVVCFRSLHSAYGIRRATSPYSTLIVGDLKTLERRPVPIVSRPASRAVSRATTPARILL